MVQAHVRADEVTPLQPDVTKTVNLAVGEWKYFSINVPLSAASHVLAFVETCWEGQGYMFVSHVVSNPGPATADTMLANKDGDNFVRYYPPQCVLVQA